MSTADAFLAQKHLFQLGDLPTETPHPHTMNLSDWASNDVLYGLMALRDVDLGALRRIHALGESVAPLFEAVADALNKGNRIFLVGCGATGRLSLSLEYLWRRAHPGSNQVCSLMAGGDVALVHSLEGFEDVASFGARHLRQLGFSPSDLLIGSTEGGETPYVIGAVEEAAASSSRPPFFLYCNPPSILRAKVERSRRVLDNPGIQSLCLNVGPMALTGSTRMQASTVLMLVIGLALEHGRAWKAALDRLEAWIAFVERSPIEKLEAFVVGEARTYQEGNFCIYTTDDMAITVFTDTTERAPTFNLAPFDHPMHPVQHHSLTYLSIPSVSDALGAWERLLGHAPRPLDWPEVHPKTSRDYMLGFDFGQRARAYREALLPSGQHYPFHIETLGSELHLRFRELDIKFPLPNLGELFDHLSLKCWLNMHSTLVMGRLGRYEGNLMTWVYPSNGKLVDRAARYTQILLKRRGLDIAYDDIVRAQFECKATLSPRESIVHKTVERLLAGNQRG